MGGHNKYRAQNDAHIWDSNSHYNVKDNENNDTLSSLKMYIAMHSKYLQSISFLPLQSSLFQRMNVLHVQPVMGYNQLESKFTLLNVIWVHFLKYVV